MKKTIITLLLLTAMLTFAQGQTGPRLATVGILPFEASGGGITADEAREITRQITAELGSWGTMTILTDGQANTAEYLVRGQLARQIDQIVLSATTSDTRTGRVLNTTRETAATIGALSIVSFCAQVAENVPFPNYLLGTWQSTINMVDGPISAILEFRGDRTVVVHRYDTWEHNGTDSLKYQAIGTGNYTYAGYLRRTVTIDRRQITTDATVGITLTLEDALPKYEDINVGGLRVLFNDARTSFELVYGALPCGDNYTGPSVYPSDRVFYTSFTKIR